MWSLDKYEYGSSMNIVAIIQARLGSTRLPSKVKLDICGKPLLYHVIRRVKQAVEHVAVAYPTKDWRVLENIVLDAGAFAFSYCGDENDLIDRHSLCAKYFDADVVIRVPGDNPCVDPDEIRRILQVYLEAKPFDLTTNLEQNTLGNGYPGGLGAEIYDAWFLHWMNEKVKHPMLREHPHLWAYANDTVQTIQAPEEIRRPHLRFDVNTKEDFEYIRWTYEALPPNFRTKDILNYLENTKNVKCSNG